MTDQVYMFIEHLSSVFVLGGCVVHSCLVIVVVVYICCGQLVVGLEWIALQVL